MSDTTANDVQEELSAWLEENWDPELTVGQWWQRLNEGKWCHPSLPEEAGGRGYNRELTQAVAAG